MLVFRIIATVFLGMSILSTFLESDALFKWKNFMLWLFWSLSWRVFVIVAIWLI